METIQSFKAFVNTACLMHKGSQCVQKYKYSMIVPAFVATTAAFLWGTAKYYRRIFENIQTLKLTQDFRKIVEQAKHLKQSHPKDITMMSETIPEFDVIIDVRHYDEYDSGHYENAISIPHTEFLPPDTQLPSFVLLSQNITPEDNILFYCHSGRRARQVIELLEKENIFKDRIYFTTEPYTKLQI